MPKRRRFLIVSTMCIAAAAATRRVASAAAASWSRPVFIAATASRCSVPCSAAFAVARCSGPVAFGTAAFPRASASAKAEALRGAPRFDFLRRSSTSTSASSDTGIEKDDDASSLSGALRDAYREGDTDAVLALVPDLLPAKHSARELVLASIDAAGGRSGPAASIMNALLGGCVVLSKTDADSGAATARELLSEWDELEEEEIIGVPTPDLVTYCLAYSAFDAAAAESGDEEAFDSMAEDVLDRARRLAKKQGGSKIRKAANAARRRGQASGAGAGGVVNAADVADDLAAQYGDDLRVLYEDNHLLVVSKPSGMVCFHKHKTNAGKVGRKKKRKKKGDGGDTAPDVSLEDALASLRVPLSNLNPDGRGIVHRIDRGTSGCIAMAKTDEAHARLVAEFFTRGARKTYDALVPADPMASEKGSADMIDNMNEGSSGEIVLPVGGKAARSIYEVRRKVGDVAFLLSLETKTGRKHQVRVHCAEGLGRPLFLDPVYAVKSKADKNRGAKGKKSKKAKDGNPGEDLPSPIADVALTSGGKQRFFLHASSLSIPRIGVDVTAPLPSWWEDALLRLDALDCQ